MRRIDALGITLGFFLSGGLVYGIFTLIGFDGISAGIWTQFFLVVVLIGWLISYLYRVGSKKMTYHQQVKDYQEAFLQKKIEELTPEELAKYLAEIEKEKDK